MSLVVSLDETPTDITAVLLRSGGHEGWAAAAAADGSMSTGSVLFDDPAGDAAIRGWQILAIDETDCVGAERLMYGTVAERNYNRGPYKSGASRVIDTDVNDSNIFLNLRLITGGDAVRPEETDEERLDWLIGSDYLDGLVYDLGFVNPIGRVYDPFNYHGFYPLDVLTDLVTPRGQIFFTYWDPAEEKVGLFYDQPSATTYLCTLSISNVLEDIDDDTVFWPYFDAQLTADPSEIYSNIRFVYKGGVYYTNNLTTAATYFPSPLLRRGVNVENDRVGKLSTAQTFATRYLNAHDSEILSVVCRTRLPSTKVGLMRQGMKLPVKFTHLADMLGSDDFVNLRIQSITYQQTEDRRDLYDVGLVLSLAGVAGSGAGSGGGSGGTGTGGGTTPFPPGPAPSPHYAAGQIDYLSDGYGSSGGPTAQTPSPTPSDNTTQSVTGSANVVLVDGLTYNYHFRHILNASDLDTGHQAGLNNPTTGLWASPHIDTTAPNTTILYEGSYTVPGGQGGTYNVIAYAGASGHVPKGSALEWWIDPDDWVTPTVDPPAQGTPIPDDPVSPDPDGSTTEFTTTYPFATNALHVSMNGVELDSGVDFTETDPASGTFTFTYAPPTDAQIVTWYIAG